MKRIISLLFLVFNFALFAQSFTLLNEDTGNYISDGDTITVSQNQYTTNIIVSNNGNAPMKATLQSVDIINTDGSEMSFCFGFHGGGNCYFSMTEGASYDSNVYNNDYLMPGESTTSDQIDFTHNDSNANFTNYPKDYVLKFIAYNANDNSVIGEINFVYRYNPNASTINTLSENEFNISGTQGSLKIINSKQTQVRIYNLTGQKVMELNLPVGNHSVQTGDLSAGIYIVFAQANGKELYKKVIIK
jgi:hypothetical protein